MNEHEQAARFNQQLDALLAGHAPPPDDEQHATLAFAQQLAAADLVAGSERFRAGLRQRLSEAAAHHPAPRKEPAMTLTRPRVARLGTLAALLLVLILLSPLRGVAADLLRQIGGIRLSHEPTLVEQLAAGEHPATVPVDPQAVPTAMPPSLLSVEEAAALAGFAVAQVTPPQGFALSGREVYWGAGGSVEVLTRFQGDGAFVTLAQAAMPTEELPAPYGQWKIGDATVREVEVRGHEGVYIEEAQIIARPAEAPGHFVPEGANILLWAEGGHTYTLLSATLELAALQGMADSLIK